MNQSEVSYRPIILDKVSVSNNGKRVVTCFCGEKLLISIVPHIKKAHAAEWDNWKKTFVKLSSLGYSLKQIMKLFRANDGTWLFSWTVIERAIKEEIESGNSSFAPQPITKVKSWAPSHFNPEKTTVWDFPTRGNWAVHSGQYRGNWPPQIPRNLIERYTITGDLVVDAFAGGGTTLIEAWLLGRSSIGLDLSKLALQTEHFKIGEMAELAQRDSRVKLDPKLRPKIIEGNALELSKILAKHRIRQQSVKLLCAHPPYLDSIKYTGNNPHDLALIHDAETFYENMRVFAREARAILAVNGTCGILIGDVRSKGNLLPLGFKTLDAFLIEGFKLDNIIVKTQHKDSSTEFWINHESNILLISHEYLFIFRNIVEH